MASCSVCHDAPGYRCPRCGVLFCAAHAQPGKSITDPAHVCTAECNHQAHGHGGQVVTLEQMEPVAAVPAQAVESRVRVKPGQGCPNCGFGPGGHAPGCPQLERRRQS